MISEKDGDRQIGGKLEVFVFKFYLFYTRILIGRCLLKILSCLLMYVIKCGNWENAYVTLSRI